MAFGAGLLEASGLRSAVGELSAPVFGSRAWPAVVAGREPAAQPIDNLVARRGLLLIPEAAARAGWGVITVEDLSHRNSCAALAVCVNCHCKSRVLTDRASCWRRVGHRPALD